MSSLNGTTGTQIRMDILTDGLESLSREKLDISKEELSGIVKSDLTL